MLPEAEARPLQVQPIRATYDELDERDKRRYTVAPVTDKSTVTAGPSNFVVYRAITTRPLPPGPHNEPPSGQLTYLV